MTCGDNINSVHRTKYLYEDEDVIVAYCEMCKSKFEVKKGDKKKYGKIFKRDLLQPSTNLYYKEHPHKMNIAN